MKTISLINKATGLTRMKVNRPGLPNGRKKNQKMHHHLLGWEFRFLVPNSGNPIGSRIPIPFQILGIPVGNFLENSDVENSSNRNSDLQKLEFHDLFLCRN